MQPQESVPTFESWYAWLCRGVVFMSVFLVFSPTVLWAQSQGPAGPRSKILAESAPPSVMVRTDGPEIVRKRYVTLDAQAVIAGTTLEVNLFPDKQFAVERVQTEAMGENGIVWFGRIPGTDGRVVLAAVDDVLVGNIRVGHELYQIQYAGEGIHVSYEVDVSKYPDEECGTAEPGSPLEKPSPLETASVWDPTNTTLTDPCDLIDVMVVYTPAARAATGDTAAMEALIYLAVAEANLAFENSDVDHRFNLVHLAEVTYTETHNMLTDVTRLRNSGDGFLDEVHTLRDRHCADLVGMIISYGSGRVFAIQDPAPATGFEDDAFMVDNQSVAAANFSLAHEFGHLMGCRHDWYVDDTTTPFTHAHGYVNDGSWRTIMAYGSECTSGCPRVGRWSNPNVVLTGDTTGVATGTSTVCSTSNTSNPDCDAENWRVLNDTACTVANFRDRSVCADGNDVWMKDTWGDTGDEPDPLTAGQHMYRSPYIWVRHTSDPTRIRQHQHENPEFGQANYVYVKLHNDFSTTATGQLKLYWARAATGLSWPTDWTIFSDAPVTIDSNSTEIVEREWSPPATGHFCMLARWDNPTTPADPMTFPEGSVVETNTRNNNNIVWRNLNVKNMPSNDTEDVEPIIVRNVEEQATSIRLQVQLPDTSANLIRAGGEVVLDLGQLFVPWLDAGGQGTGVVLGQGTKVLVLDTSNAIAEINGIPMTARQEAQVQFTITAPEVVYVPTADVNEEPLEFCSPGDFDIPDDQPAGITDNLSIPDCLIIDDLDLTLKTNHTWVGDLRYTLTHLESQRTAVALDRPGFPATNFGCSGHDIDVALDDDAVNPVEDECSQTVPTIQGGLIPGDPPDAQAFEVFAGLAACGIWELNVSDHALGDFGQLGQWCLSLGQEQGPAGPVTDYSLDLVQLSEDGGEIGGVGYEVRVTPEGGVGAVPPSTLRLGKTTNGECQLWWGASCTYPEAADTDYVIYEGTLGDFYSHVPERCSTVGVTSAIVPPSSGNRYYIVVPRNRFVEGSHGVTSTGAQRPTGPEVCVQRDFGGC
jgi:subtilisin-like proprotein convertase family protein